MVRAHDTRSARLRLTAAKRGMQRLTHTALHRYWTDLSQRIQCCADTGDLHGMYQGIKEAIGPTSKKTATFFSEDGRPISDPEKLIFLRWFKLVHIYIRERTLHNEVKQGVGPQFQEFDFTWSYASSVLKNCKQSLRVRSWKTKVRTKKENKFTIETKKWEHKMHQLNT